MWYFTGEISSSSPIQKYNKANSKIESNADGSDEVSIDPLNQND